MIKCEVVFDGDYMMVNGWNVVEGSYKWSIHKNDSYHEFEALEQAITYCMDQSNV